MSTPAPRLHHIEKIEEDNWRTRLTRALGAQAGTRIGASYVIRTTLAATASLVVSRMLHIANPIWAVVSSVVVIMPEVHTSVASAAWRVVANLIGAGVGVGIALLALPSIPSLVMGLLVVAALCRLTGLDGAARSASVALVIVLLREHTAQTVLGSSETRVVLVLLGCVVALVVTIVAAQLERALGALTRRRDAP
jgi:uncharacterized membrane protein YgaE (UPF0421/DUF939 family)